MEKDVTFKRSPVVETVLGVHFERLKGLTNAHLGAFWEQRKADWPQVSDAPPLVEQLEIFGKQIEWNPLCLGLTQTPPNRVQMRNAAGDRMIQLQNCRLHYNWIGQPGREYPRYRKVRPEFDAVLRDFGVFILGQNLGELVPNQWEVTYVNHLPKGTVWNEPADWTGVFQGLPGLAATPERARLEGFAGHWHFEIPPQQGRLHVEVQHARVGEARQTEVLVMQLTARGPVGQEKDAALALGTGLNLGHEVIVTSFEQLTSVRAREFWNREEHDVTN